MKTEKNCLFCKIARGEIPSEKVWEDENFFAFADVHPRVKGHTLVIPKEHFSGFMELDKKILDKYLGAIKKVAKIVVKKYDANGFNIASNNGKSAGQIINHVHFHILPRKTGDNKKDVIIG